MVMPDRARVVIVGGGIAGASIAYHLGRLGWRDVVVLEQGELAGGTTSHAPGLVGQLRSSLVLTRLLMYSTSLYRQLHLDGQPCYDEVGSLRLASSPARFDELVRQADFARQAGLEASLLAPAEAARLCPFLALHGIEGALWVPGDGSAAAPALARALIRDASAVGIRFCPHTRLAAVKVAGGAVRAVETSTGAIETEILIAASGIWSPLVGQIVGVALALVPLEHQYVVTAPVAELAGHRAPNLRDPDKLVYLRQHGESLILGGYERRPRTFAVRAIPDRPQPTVRPFAAARFEPLRRAAAERVPALAEAELARRVNGLESFTPDGQFLLGPVGQVRGFWVACGFCAHGISGAGGVGKVLAEWIVHGEPGLDLSEMAPDRFGARAADATYVAKGASRVYGTYYDILPNQLPLPHGGLYSKS